MRLVNHSNNSGAMLFPAYLDAEGTSNIKFCQITFQNPNLVEYHHSEVEIDGISEDPPVIIEVTSILKTEKKIDDFIKKIRFLNAVTDKKFRGFFVAATSEFPQETLGEIIVRLKKNNCELINL